MGVLRFGEARAVGMRVSPVLALLLLLPCALAAKGEVQAVYDLIARVLPADVVSSFQVSLATLPSESGDAFRLSVSARRCRCARVSEDRPLVVSVTVYQRAGVSCRCGAAL